MKIIIRKKFDSSEPYHCMRTYCREELNALNIYTITLAKGFSTQMHLCYKHAAELDLIRKESQNSINLANRQGEK